MDNYGFIHERLDIKILILYVLRRLPLPIDGESLADLILIDDGINYFEYKQCLAELVVTQQVRESEAGFAITAKGREDGEALETTIPYSVRKRAEEAFAPIVSAMQRDAMIVAKHDVTSDGVMVRLTLSDGISDILDLKILAADEEHANVMKKNFKKDAEGFYKHFIECLSE